MAGTLCRVGAIAGACAIAAFGAPPKPPSDLWLEGESCADHDFTTIGRDAAFGDCYGAAILQLQTHAAPPPSGYHASYRAAIPAAGWYTIRVAATKPDPVRLCPYSVHVTGYAPRSLRDFPVTDAYGPGGIFGWLTVGTFALPAGEAEITFRCAETRKTHGDYLLYLDALSLQRVQAPSSEQKWLAAEDPGVRLFRCRFPAAGASRRPRVTVAAGTESEVVLNGELLGRTAIPGEPAAFFPATPLRTEADNILEIRLGPGTPATVTGLVEAADGDGILIPLTRSGDGLWQALSEAGAETPVRVSGDLYAAPWGDRTVGPATRRPVPPLPIPIKTGNLSVELILAAVGNRPLPAVRPQTEFDEFRRFGGVSGVEDYICWLPLEPERDSPRWEFYLNNRDELHARGMRYGVYPWLHFVPDWVLESEFWEPLSCLEHGESTWAPSIWSPKTRLLFDRFYAQLRERFGDGIDDVYVSLVADYGEAGYPVGMTRDLVPTDHIHPGFWCGDPGARADFGTRSLARYGDLAALNAAWGTAFRTPAEIVYPPDVGTEGPAREATAALPPTERGPVRRRWLDFCEWYLDSMVRFAGEAVALSRSHFPGRPHEIKIGFGSEQVALGADYTAFAARAQADGYTVRSTHGKLPFYFYRRFSTATKHYGVPLVTEPPSDVSRDEEVVRMYKDATSGTTEYFDYPGNLLGASDLIARFGRYMEGQHSITRVAFLFPTTDHRLTPKQSNPEALLGLSTAARDYFDWDILDERLLKDGAADRYSVFIIAEGDVWEASSLETLARRVREGAVLIRFAGGAIETVEGDRAFDAEHFPNRGDRLPDPEALLTVSGDPLPACRIDVGDPGDAAALTGEWYRPESGHWEWGGPPDGVRKRWTGGRAGFLIPDRADEPMHIALEVARHPKLLHLRADVTVNGRRVGSLPPARTSTFRARIPARKAGESDPVRIEIDTESWLPAEVDGSADGRRLGVAVRRLTVRFGDTPEPAEAAVPRLAERLRRELFLSRCVTRIGSGAAVLLPLSAAEGGRTARVVSEILHDRSLFPGTVPPVVVADSTADDILTALMPSRVLLLNRSSQARDVHLAFDPQAFAAAGLPQPLAEQVSVRLEPMSLGSVELPGCRVLRP